MIEGLLLIIFSFFVFSKPATLLDWFVGIAGIFSVALGAINLFRYFFGESSERSGLNFLSSVMLIGMGILLITNVNEAKEWLLVVISGLFLMLSVHVFLQAWEIKYAFKWWGISVLILIYSIFTAYLVVRKTEMLGISLSVWIGLQILALGILMVWISIIDRKIAIEYKRTLQDLKNS